MIAPSLPRLCVNGCGRPVLRSDKWQVGHIVGAEYGGKPVLSNVGPAHVKCNTSDGGRRGAAITNAAKKKSHIRHGNW
ncbi:HNH endonuclease [Rathayibacter sp. AY1B5]|uniref:HNH endonuclease n=1 Tax=Rathayibacter sp. AY1B5 TaxID=2080530 RepID=UPI0011B0E859